MGMRKGQPLSEAQLAAMVRGRNRVWTPWQRAAAGKVLGTPKSEAHKEALRQANFGKKATQATKDKMSATRKKLGIKPPYDVEAVRKANTGRVHTEAEKKKRADACRGHKRTEATKQLMCIARAKQVMSLKDTKPERRLQAVLSNLGIAHRKHGLIPGVPFHQWDVLLTDRKVAIEADGCYWHGCVDCGYDPTPERSARDQALTAAAQALGWLVIRIWEHEPDTATTTRLSEEIS